MHDDPRVARTLNTLYLRPMPPKSQAQRKWAYYTAAHGKTAKARAVGKEFEGHGIKGLPAKVSHSSKIAKAYQRGKA